MSGDKVYRSVSDERCRVPGGPGRGDGAGQFAALISLTARV